MKRALHLVAIVAALCLAGCENQKFRNADAVQAEDQALKTTIPFANAYKTLHPAETGEVDAFYRSWQKRLDQEKVNAGVPTSQP